MRHRHPASFIPKILSRVSRAAAAAAAAEDAKASAQETVSELWPLAADGTLRLKNVNGDVHITAWDRAEVQMVAEKRVKAESDEEARELLARLTIDVESTPDSLRIETCLPRRSEEDAAAVEDLFRRDRSRCGVTCRLQVPRGAVIEADNLNGNIRLTGTRGTGRLATLNGCIETAEATGALLLECTNGGIRLTRADGKIRAEATNGYVDMELVPAAEGPDLALSTTNGEVTVRLPRDARLSVDATVLNGRIESAFELADGNDRRSRLSGELNGGGGALRIRATNGSARLVEVLTP